MLSFQKELKRKVIREYVEEYNRAPTEQELVVLLRESKDVYYNAENTGFLFNDLESLQFGSKLDHSVENDNRYRSWHDSRVILRDLFTLLNKSQMEFDMAMNTLDKGFVALQREEDRVDELLFYFSKKNSFLYSQEEDFSNFKNLDISNTTLKIKKNLLTLDTDSYEKVDSKNLRLNLASLTKGVQSTIDGNIKDIVRYNNYTLPFRIYSRTLTPISFFLDITLNDSAEIRIVDFDLEFADSKGMMITPYYSTDNITFNKSVYGTVEARNRNSFGFDYGKLKKIRFVFTKNEFDSFDNDIYTYEIFFKNLSCYTGSLRYSTGEIICGPYYFSNRNAEEISFNKAQVLACTLEPEGTSVSMYLSTDRTEWIPVNHRENFGNIVVFSENDLYSVVEEVDNSRSVYYLTDIDSDFVSKKTEALFNFKINASYKDSIIMTKLDVYRSFVDEDGTLTTSNGVSGWILDKVKGTASCVVEVKQSGGMTIDLGPRGAIVNGVKVVGNAHFIEGINTFSTSRENWSEVSSEVLTEKELKNVDKLYPYNHRYLIEGYNYNSGFSGNKKYLGLGNVYGAKLRYISPELFNVLDKDDELYYNSFTHFVYNGYIYFKTKVRKSSAYWRNDNIILTSDIQNSEYNSLYLKILLETVNNISPVVQSFNIRVK